jgi:hypothetical protein
VPGVRGATGRSLLIESAPAIGFHAARMGTRDVIALGAALAGALVAPGAACAGTVAGPHETVTLASTTTRPGASSGFAYAARYHAAHNPDGDPPALRRLVFKLPRGSRIDTTVVPRCTATDTELKLAGEGACPVKARIGAGAATIKGIGLGSTTYKTVIYNAPNDMMELVKSGNKVIAVAHTYIHGTTLDGPVPTCVSGGNPPDGCPFDQIRLDANHLRVRAISVGHGRAQRRYGTTPRTCPRRTRRWRARIAVHYADGSIDRLVTRGRCKPRRARPTRR